MPSACFSTFAAVFFLLGPFVAYTLYWRVRLGGTLVMREDFARLPNGDLDGGQAYFHAQSRTLEWRRKEGPRLIPFGEISAIILEVRTSRKIHVCLGIGEEVLQVGIVSNHDLKRAGINGHLMAETLAGQGEDFLLAFRQHHWQRELIGARFEFAIHP